MDANVFNALETLRVGILQEVLYDEQNFPDAGSNNALAAAQSSFVTDAITRVTALITTANVTLTSESFPNVSTDFSDCPSPNPLNVKLQTILGTISDYALLNAAPAGPTGASFNVVLPVSQTFTAGTAFQPRSDGACALNVIGAMTGSVGDEGSVAVSMSAMSGGTYTQVAISEIVLATGSTTGNVSIGAILIPTGYYVKIAVTGAATATCLCTNL